MDILVDFQIWISVPLMLEFHLSVFFFAVSLTEKQIFAAIIRNSQNTNVSCFMITAL